MKKKLLCTIGILTAAALSLSACGKTASEAPAVSADAGVSAQDETKEDTPSEETPAEEDAPAEDAVSAEDTADINADMSPDEIMDLRYGTIVEKYLTAITDQWTAEDLENNDMSFLTTYHYDKGVESMGVNGNYDLNGDGSPELLIGDMDENSDHVIYAAYTMKGTDAVPLFISSERDRYYLTELLDDDPMAVNVYRIGSNGASDSFNATYLV